MSDREVMTTREAADFLSMHEKTLVRKAKAGSVPAAKVGREWRFSKRQLMAWLEEGGIRQNNQASLRV